MKIAQGIVKFQTEVFHEKRELFRKLATSQTPEALFITCSDSRIDPNLLTQTDPGELFICRCAGNIVPPHAQEHTGAMTASIEFAVGRLAVKHIIVCGHTDCGAMRGALDKNALDDLPHVRAWLAHAPAPTPEILAAGGDDERLEAMTRRNVLLQIAHVRTHPAVAAALKAGRVTLHGWIYDIASGEVLAYDERLGDFIPVADHYRDRRAAP